MPCAAYSGWRSSLAYLPGAPPGCYIPPGGIQRACRAANCYSRSKTVCRTSGGQISQPAGLHGCQPNTHQQENSLQHSSTPNERCLHWLAATCSRNQQDTASSRLWGGINQPICLGRFTARRRHCRAQRAAVFNFQPAASTRTHNLQLLRPQFWLHIIWCTDCKCTQWIGRRSLPGWWSSQRI